MLPFPEAYHRLALEKSRLNSPPCPSHPPRGGRRKRKGRDANLIIKAQASYLPGSRESRSTRLHVLRPIWEHRPHWRDQQSYKK